MFPRPDQEIPERFIEKDRARPPPLGQKCVQVVQLPLDELIQPRCMGLIDLQGEHGEAFVLGQVSEDPVSQPMELVSAVGVFPKTDHPGGADPFRESHKVLALFDPGLSSEERGRRQHVLS